MAAWVYALRFDPPYHHATAYLGSTGNLMQRLQQHMVGEGNGLVKAAIDQGHRCEVICLTLRNTKDARQIESRLKRWHSNRKAIEFMERHGAISITSHFPHLLRQNREIGLTA